MRGRSRKGRSNIVVANVHRISVVSPEAKLHFGLWLHTAARTSVRLPIPELCLLTSLNLVVVDCIAYMHTSISDDTPVRSNKIFLADRESKRRA
jgi:hypothetical protein